MSVVIRPAVLEDADAAQRIMNDAKNSKWLGGFTMLADLEGRFTKQTETGIIAAVVAVKDDEVVGVSQISPHDFHIEMGLVAVKTGHKREGYGRAMYTLHALRAAMEGRLFLLDQINWQNEGMKGFLPALSFEGPEVTLRNKIRNFCTLEYWRYDFAKSGLAPWLEGLNESWEYDIRYNSVYDKKLDEILDKLSEQKRQQDHELILNISKLAKNHVGVTVV
jgi:hypothetical protein